MSSFDTIRKLFDKDHRQVWEDALSALEVFKGSRIRIIATTPEKVLQSPGHKDLPEVSAQVLFSDESDIPRVSLDFYEEKFRVVVAVTFYLGEVAVAGGFCPIADIEEWIATGASPTTEYLRRKVEETSKELGNLQTR